MKLGIGLPEALPYGLDLCILLPPVLDLRQVELLREGVLPAFREAGRTSL